MCIEQSVTMTKVYAGYKVRLSMVPCNAAPFQYKSLLTSYPPPSRAHEPPASLEECTQYRLDPLARKDVTAKRGDGKMEKTVCGSPG
jgi:hypothetical protein